VSQKYLNENYKNFMKTVIFWASIEKSTFCEDFVKSGIFLTMFLFDSVFNVF